MAVQTKTLTLTSTSPISIKNTVKFLYSYGGKILPRPSDSRLRYIGGLTRVISVHRSISFSELMAKLEKLCGYSANLRCQLPSEDLDVLITIKSDDDLLNVIEEYDRASSNRGKELKIRAILSPLKSSSSSTSSSSSATTTTASPISASASAASLSSSSSSSSLERSDTSPSKCDHQRRSVSQKPPIPTIRRSSPLRNVQYGVVRNCYNYNHYPCHIQASFQPSSYFSHPSNRSH